MLRLPKPLIVVLCLSAPAAMAEHTDALLLMDPTGSLVTGEYDLGSASVASVNTRIYEGEFDAFFSTDEPGFNALGSAGSSGLPAGYTTLPGEKDVTFTAKTFAVEGQSANLFHWDGVGLPAFAPVTDVSLHISKSPSLLFDISLTGADQDVAGFVIDTTGADGFLHKHIDFSLVANAGDPAAGFYAWSLSFTVDAIESWDVFFIHGAGIENEPQHEAAIDYFASNVVPEPASLILMGLGLATLWRRGSKNRLAD